jgi:hypothetical protein
MRLHRTIGMIATSAQQTAPYYGSPLTLPDDPPPVIMYRFS